MGCLIASVVRRIYYSAARQIWVLYVPLERIASTKGLPASASVPLTIKALRVLHTLCSILIDRKPKTLPLDLPVVRPNVSIKIGLSFVLLYMSAHNTGKGLRCCIQDFLHGHCSLDVPGAWCRMRR